VRLFPVALLVVGAAVGREPRPLRVWCVGDSITQRYAPVLAARGTGWAVTDLGVGGERSDAGRDRLAGLLAASPEPPDVVVLLFGANDVVAGPLRGEAGYGPAEAAANIGEMVARVRSRGGRVLVGLPSGAPPLRPGDPPEARAIVRKLRRGFARLRRLLQLAYPGATVDLRLSRYELFADVVHPTPAGSDVLARAVARAVVRDRRKAAATAR
jgi:lysophospholipase L1-like esterase